MMSCHHIFTKHTALEGRQGTHLLVEKLAPKVSSLDFICTVATSISRPSVGSGKGRSSEVRHNRDIALIVEIANIDTLRKLPPVDRLRRPRCGLPGQECDPIPAAVWGAGEVLNPRPFARSWSAFRSKISWSHDIRAQRWQGPDK